MRVLILLPLLLVSASCLYNYDELRGSSGGGGVGGQAGMGTTGGKGGEAGVNDSGGAGGLGGIMGIAGNRGSTGGAVGPGGTTGTGGKIATTGSGGSPAGSGGIGGGAGVSVAATGGAAGSVVATGGSGGSTAHGGTTGTGGSAGTGPNTCPLAGTLDCSNTGALTLTPDGLVTDFSTFQWNSSTGEWCDADGLGGSVFAYSGASPSTAASAVDTTTQNLKLNLTVGAQGYAGAGLFFLSCVNASSFSSVLFTASVTAGSMTGCSWQVQLQTQDQRPTSATSPTGGTCNPDAGASCYRYPTTTLTAPTTTATTFTEGFTLFNNPASSPIATPTQITGIQWQVNSANSGAGTCTVELRIDNIKFQ